MLKFRGSGFVRNPVSYDDDQEIKTIGQNWRIIRWPALHEEGIINGISRLTISHREYRIRPFLTIGLPVGEEYPWRIPTPKTINELNGLLISKCRTLHIVGHHPLDSGELRISSSSGEELIVDVDKIQAYNLKGPKNIIISACSSGNAVFQNNLPIEISLSSRSVVWAPIVSIRQDDAENLDIQLSRFSHTDNTVSSSMLNILKMNSLLNLYVRYGIF